MIHFASDRKVSQIQSINIPLEAPGGTRNPRGFLLFVDGAPACAGFPFGPADLADRVSVGKL